MTLSIKFITKLSKLEFLNTFQHYYLVQNKLLHRHLNNPVLRRDKCYYMITPDKRMYIIGITNDSIYLYEDEKHPYFLEQIKKVKYGSQRIPKSNKTIQTFKDSLSRD